jgi:poly(hydroxyalkanoate) granule-associated protein
MPAKKATKAKQAEKARDAERDKKNAAAAAADLVRRPLLMSLGAISLIEEELADLMDSWVERGEKAQKNGRKYIKKLRKKGAEIFKETKEKAKEKAEEAQEEVEPKEELIPRILHWLNIPTHEDIQALDKRVDDLLKKVA